MGTIVFGTYRKCSSSIYVGKLACKLYEQWRQEASAIKIRKNRRRFKAHDMMEPISVVWKITDMHPTYIDKFEVDLHDHARCGSIKIDGLRSLRVELTLELTFGVHTLEVVHGSVVEACPVRVRCVRKVF